METDSRPSPATAHQDDTGDAASGLFRAFVRDGDRDALEAAMLSVAPSLRAAARRLAKSSDVDDLLHDCFVIAIRRAPDFAAGRRLLPWLLGVLQNVARTRHRRRWARLLASSAGDDDRRILSEALVAPTAKGADPDREVWLGKLSVCLQNLSEPYRSVLAGHLLRGEPLVAIAARLRRPASTVRVQFARGLRELRRRLPAPMLAGLTALLSVREANAGAPSALDGVARRRMVSPAGAATMVVAAAAFLTWQAYAPTPGTGVPSPLESPPTTSRATPAEPVTGVESGPETELLRHAPAPMVTAILRYENGSPAVGMRVMFEADHVQGSSVWRSRAAWRTATTDGEGLVRFDAAGRGLGAIRIHDGAVLHRFALSSEPQSLTLKVPEEPPMPLRVTDVDGRPIEGARVICSASDGNGAPGWLGAVTAVDGNATIVSPLAVYTVRVLADGYAPSPMHIVRVAGLTTIATSAVRLAPAGHAVHGAVVLPDGTPATQATVVVWPEDDTTVPPCFVAVDQGGRFTHPAPGTSWSVSACAAGCAPVVARSLDASAEPKLLLTAGGSIRGRLDVLGTASAQRLLAWAEPLNEPRNPLARNAARVDVDGRFHIAALSPGPYELRVMAGEIPCSEPVRVTIAEGTVVEVGCTMKPPAVWRVRVQDDRGMPLANCQVRVRGTNFLTIGDHGHNVITDAEGCVGLPMGNREPVQVFVHLPQGSGHDPLAVMGVAGTAGDDIVVNVPVEKLGSGHVSGQIVIAAVPPRIPISLCLSGIDGARRLEAGDDGRLWAKGLPPGKLSLRLVCECDGNFLSRALRDVVVEPGVTTELGGVEVPELLPVRISLANGSVGTGVRAELFDAAGESVGTIGLTTARPTTLHLPRGRYRLVHADSHAATRSREFAIEGGAGQVVLDPGLGCRCRVEISPRRLPDLVGCLHGTVRLDEQPPCTIWLEPTPERTKWCGELDLAPGRYTFAATFGSEAVAGTLVVVPGVHTQVFPLSLP